ncbi:DNA polymerase III subunit delta [Tundrisphaera lichenicola]|uniref:DNA polymerase III subunit delta n=1 Tax=Tundrisphaera lichenicola TaxID=2029860 RepID=UPI003EB75D70
MPMHAFEFLRPANHKTARPIYALSGDDAYLRDEAIRAIARAALGSDNDDMALSRFPGDQSKLADVLDEVRTLPFLAKCRVVIVDGADPFVTAHRKELETYAEKPSTSGILVLSVKSWPGNTKLAKLVEKSGLAIECKTPDERELPGWLIQLAKARFGVKLEADAAQLLVELVGPEVGLLASEVEKLYVYVGERPSIAREDVAKMVGAGRVETLWSTVDAATTGQGAEALADLDKLLGSGEAPVRLLAGMSFSLLKLHHAGQLRRARVELREACQKAGIFPGGVEKARQQHAHLGPSRVDQLPGLLLQADLDIKGDSTLTPRVILERLLVRLAAKRQD